MTADQSIWRLAWKVANHEPRTFWWGSAFFTLFFMLPAVIGLVLARAFDALADGNTGAVYRWAVVLVALETVRMVSVHAGAVIYTKAWIHMQTFLRANLLAAQVASGGPEAGQPIGSAGESITHFRDDADDVAQLIDGVVDVTGGAAFAVVAVVALGTANAAAAAVLVVPMLSIVVVTRVLDSRVKSYRAHDRVATGDVTSLVGDIMAAATTVKVNRADSALLARLKTRVDRRRTTAVRDRVLDESVMAFSRGATDLGLALVLVVGAAALADGSFSVGQLALFVSYMSWLGYLPRMAGRVIARRKQAGVAFARMSVLVAEQDVSNTVLPRSLPIERWQNGVRPAESRPTRVPLEVLEVESLSARYGSGAGVGPVSFTMRRGDFVVITGTVGSGKSTLLRAVLGISSSAQVAGTVRWNGEAIADRAAFFVPPNASFLPQVPQLISDSVADNIFLGDVDPQRLAEALALAELDDDVANMPVGAATLIGPRGLRLSGGQRQRLAAARAVVHRPELVVLDDLSSALDVETELRLWEKFAAAGMTVLAVSHREVAFDWADRVYRLDGGQLTLVREYQAAVASG
ncbi:MAG TPA: ABC transporter ATP-binding protein [Ilumatobacter sp.]|nr:ABC transporter ATP-binding protein [Ilumatobacter sp.]